MRIHAMCLVKNEGDVIEECLRAASTWADRIYVWDNGSDDGTWETVQRLGQELEPVVPWRQLATAHFDDGLRREIFAEFADQASDDDWWVRLDADEFYVQNPRVFLRALPPRYGIVWYASLSYYLSSAAAAEYRERPDSFADEVPTAEKCRYYYNHWSEVRFVKHSVLDPWTTDSGGWPAGLHRRAEACPIRIVAQHFPYRSPQQIERRIETRAASAVGGGVFNHEAITDWSSVVDPKAVKRHRWKDIAYATASEELERGWESRVIDAGSLEFDAHDGRYVLNEGLMPQIPGSRAGEVAARAETKARAVARRLLRR